MLRNNTPYTKYIISDGVVRCARRVPPPTDKEFNISEFKCLADLLKVSALLEKYK